MEASDLTTIELLFLRQTGNYVVAEDIEGKERWFDVRKVNCHIEGEDLTVILPTKDWKRRVNNPEVQVRENRHVVKTCIICRQPRTMEKQNYICDGCKSTPEWKCSSGPFDL